MKWSPIHSPLLSGISILTNFSETLTNICYILSADNLHVVLFVHLVDDENNAIRRVSDKLSSRQQRVRS